MSDDLPTLNGRALPPYAICSQEEVEEHRELTKNGHWKLITTEHMWVARQAYLEQKGYVLRPRYKPDWKPSWIGTRREPEFCEDSVSLPTLGVIDATRSSDSSRVSIKIVKRNTTEISIARFLSSQRMLQDAKNHCVPVFDVLSDSLDANKSLMVMPYLCPFNEPEFCAVGEVIDFFGQALEGMAFMHSQGVAHRDCATHNIMMDGRPLFPQGHHPVRHMLTPDAVFPALPLSRLDVPVKYYFIDFGLSTRFRDGESTYVLGRAGRCKEIPELSNEVPYDAFRADIFALGWLFYEEFAAKYYDLEILFPLIGAMVQGNPQERPSAPEAVAMFEEIRKTFDGGYPRWRLRSREEVISVRLLFDTMDVVKASLWQLGRLFKL